MVQYTIEQLQGMNITSLKKIGKNKKIPGYSTWKSTDNMREQVIGIIINHQQSHADINEQPIISPIIDYTVDQVQVMKITKLKKVAKQLGIPGFSTYNTTNIEQLRSLVIQTLGIDRQNSQVTPERVYMMGIRELKKVARQMKIPNVTKYRKNNEDALRTLIIEQCCSPVVVESLFSASPIDASDAIGLFDDEIPLNINPTKPHKQLVQDDDEIQLNINPTKQLVQDDDDDEYIPASDAIGLFDDEIPLNINPTKQLVQDDDLMFQPDFIPSPEPLPEFPDDELTFRPDDISSSQSLNGLPIESPIFPWEQASISPVYNIPSPSLSEFEPSPIFQSPTPIEEKEEKEEKYPDDFALLDDLEPIEDEIEDEIEEIQRSFPVSGGFLAPAEYTPSIINKRSTVQQTLIPITKVPQKISPHDLMLKIKSMNVTDTRSDDIVKVQNSIDELLEKCTLMV